MDTAPPSTPLPAQRVIVFDSGIGGITILSALKVQAPGLNIGYAADTGFFPYGDKSDAALSVRVPDVAEALVAATRPDIFVIACNTASTLALDAVRARLDIPVIGTVPAIKPAAAATATKTIGLLATPGTLGRPYTARLIADHALGVRVLTHGSVELVRLAERHAAGEEVRVDQVAGAQAPLFAQAGAEDIDTIVLACTHFPLLRDLLIKAAPRPITYIDSGDAIARQTLKVLSETPAPGALHADIGAWRTSRGDEEPQLADALARFGFQSLSEVTVPPAKTG
ncbi:MAG: glutamate racemase [Pseudomonadota bacterium]